MNLEKGVNLLADNPFCRSEDKENKRGRRPGGTLTFTVELHEDIGTGLHRHSPRRMVQNQGNGPSVPAVRWIPSGNPERERFACHGSD